MVTTGIKTLSIIAIHGNGGGAFRFDRLHEYMPDDIRLNALTLPGFADKPRDPALKTMRDYAAYMHNIVMQEQHPVILLGTGIGGSMIMEYVQHYPESIDGVILHAPVGTRLDTRRFPWLMSLPGARSFGQWLFSSPLARPLFKRLLFVDYTQIPPDYLNRFFNEYRQAQAFSQMFDIITAEWYNALQPSDVPAALLWGEDERVLDVDHVEDYKALMTNHIVHIVPGWDHFPMIEQPEAYTNEIIELSRKLIRKAS